MTVEEGSARQCMTGAEPSQRRSGSPFDSIEPTWVQLDRKTQASGGWNVSLSTASFGGLDNKKETYVGETSTVAAGANLVTTMIGAGVLAFPGLFAKGGWVLSFVVLVASALACLETGRVIDQIAMWAEEQATKYHGEYSFGTRPQVYEDILEVAFGNKGKLGAFLAFNILLVLICGAYMILIGLSLEYILRHPALPYRACVLIMACVHCPLIMIDRMSLLAKFSSIGVLSCFVYVACIAYAGFSETADRSHDRPIGDAFKEVGQLISVMLLAFGCQLVLPTVRSEMAVPQELPKAILGGIILVIFVYALVGVAGFYGYGIGASGNVLRNMVTPDGNTTIPGIVLSVAVICNLTVTIPIVMTCVCRAIEARRSGYSFVVRFICFFSALLVSFLCPFFLEFFSIISALLNVPLVIILPIVVFWKLQGGDNSSGTSVWETKTKVFCIIRHVCVLILGLVAFVVGTINSFDDLINSIKQGGRGFWDHSY